MMGRTHALTGAAGWLGAVQLHTLATGHRPGIAATVLGAIVCAGGALLPDLDQDGSNAARTFGYPTRLMAKGIERISGGHRHATHSLIAVGFVYAATTAIGYVRDTVIGSWLFLAMLTLLIGAALRALRLEPFHRDNIIGLGNLAVSATTAYLTARTAPGAMHIVPLAATLGAYLHIMGDCCTDHGCPLAWPIPTRYALLPERLRWRTCSRKDGSFSFERHILSNALLAAIAWFTLRTFLAIA